MQSSHEGVAEATTTLFTGFYFLQEVWHAPIFFPTQAAAEHSISGAHFGSHP